MSTDEPRAGGPTEDDETGNPRLVRAVLESWPVWVVATVAFAIALYLNANKGLVAGTKAERFYVIIFAVVTVVSSGYGALAVRGRVRTYGL